MPDIASLQNQLRQWKDYYSTQPNGEQQLYQKVAEYAQQQNLSPDVVNQVIQGVAPNADMWNSGRVQGLMDQYAPPQYGLQGAQSAINQGTTNASQSINTGLGLASGALMQGQNQALAGLAGTQQQVSGLFNQGRAALQPFAKTGVQANDLQAALSGALGPEAQKAAFANYQESPGVDYARSQAEKAITRNASALGGLGGGNVMSELMRNAVGTYLQDFGNQFNRTGQVADRGFSAAGAQAGLSAQEAGLQGQLGQFGAQIPLQTGQNIADLNTAAYGNVAGMQYGAGNNVGGLRYQTGQDLASSVSSTSSALSQLINQQGAGMADITGNTTNNLNTLYQQAAAGDANAMEQLAALLGNISTQNASMVGNQPIIPGNQTNYLGQLGTLASGVGGLAEGLNYGQQPATQPVYGPKAPVGSSQPPSTTTTLRMKP